MRDWLELLATLGPQFAFDTTGRTFSLLPETHPVPVGRFSDSPEDDFRELLDQLVRKVGPGAGTQVFSTLRSTRYRPGEVVQALYTIGRDGTVQLHIEVGEAQTTPAPQPASLGGRVRLMGAGLVAGLLILAVSAWLGGWKDVVAALLRTRATIAREDVTVEASHFSPYFGVVAVRVTADGTAAVLTLRRTERYPLDDPRAAAAIAAAGDSVAERLAVEALVRGYVRYEIFDEADTLLYTGERRVAGLTMNETETVAVPLGSPPGVRRVVIGF